MDQNRRRFLRKAPDELTVIQIERDEVGKVLNISEGGLSFRSVMPVPRNLPVYFWFSFNLKDKIEAMGEVAWTDISRTVGGLRFTQISQAGREQIQKWLLRRRVEEFPEEEIEVVLEDEIPEEDQVPAPQLVAAGGPVPIRMNEPVRVKTSKMKPGEPDRVAKFVSKARAYRPISSFEGRSNGDSRVAPPPALGIEPPKSRSYRTMFSMDVLPTKAAESGDSKFSSLSFKGIESLVELVPVQRYLSAKKRQLLCGVFLGVCLSAGVALSVLKFWNYRAQADMKPAATDSASLRSNNNVPAQAPVTTPTATAQAKPSYPIAGVFSEPIPLKNIPLKKGTTSILSARSAPADFYRQNLPKSVAAKASKQTVGTLGEGQSRSASATNNANKKPGMSPTQLWGAVQAGNSKAAVELAELYIKGDGVPQNCQQARVLLLVASEKRNTAAIKRLQQLDKQTVCP
jgi:hypothetical protein